MSDGQTQNVESSDDQTAGNQIEAEPLTVGLDPSWISNALKRDGVAPTEVTFQGFIGTVR